LFDGEPSSEQLMVTAIKNKNREQKAKQSYEQNSQFFNTHTTLTRNNQFFKTSHNGEFGRDDEDVFEQSMRETKQAFFFS
jgi:CMP-N-acetylneuraminic acid synthetase